ncbi:MAG: MATE family efflux transporter [Lachnospiraceae bacterium]|nr:MATE family efflux transporter [Lachnospiraceae bacterium]
MGDNIKMMENVSEKKALLAFGLPTVVGMLSTGIYNLIDGLYVARLSTEAMDAVSIMYPIVTLISGLGLLIGNGAAVYISELLGKKKRQEAETVLATALFTSLLLGIALQLFHPFLKNILSLIGATEEILPYALPYARVVFLGFIFQLLSVCMMNLVRAEGQVYLSTFSMLIGAGVSIVADPIAIFTLKGGIIGAACVNALSQFVSFLVLACFYLGKRSALRISFRKISYRAEFVKPVLSVGIPVFCVNLFQCLSSGIANILAKPFGVNGLAALAIANRMLNLSVLGITGFARGYQNLASYNFGAGRGGRLREITKLAIGWTTGICGCVAVCQMIFAGSIAGAFSTEQEVIALGRKALFCGSILLVTYGFQSVGSVYLLCIHRPKAGLVFSIARQGIFYIPLILLLSVVFGLNGIFYTQPLADFCTTIALILYLKHIQKEQES